MPKHFHSLILLATVLFTVANGYGQIPTKCLEIESVLVDACNEACSGALEGENEMFRFIVGPNPIPLTQLTAQWATPNGFLGWVQDGTSANVTAQLNATITSCGYLVEPPNGIIPAGKRVLGITSTNVCIDGNSFAQLNDTLYVIYQEPGNTFGHFKNTSSIGPLSNTPNSGASFRTFILGVSSPLCADTVMYNIAQLVNSYGTYGGSYAENDGSSLLVSWPGPPEIGYVNFGCQAPITPFTVSVSDPGLAVPCGASVPLLGGTTGNVVETYWSGGAGSFSNMNGNVTTYTLAASESNGVILDFCAVNACGDTICAPVQLDVLGSPSASIATSGPTTFCQGDTLELTANGATSYVWSTGEQTPMITVDASGTYTVTATNSCGQATASVEIVVTPGPTATIGGPATACQGQPFELFASGGLSYSWNTGEVTDTITATGPGSYSVTVNTSCGVVSRSIEVLPGVSFQPTFSANNAEGCAPLCTSLTAEDLGAASYIWSFSDGSTEMGSFATHCFTSGVHDVTLTVAPLGGDARCPGSLTENDLVHAWPTPLAQFSMDPSNATIEAPTIRFMDESSGATAWSWHFGDPSDSSSYARYPIFTYDDVDCYIVLLEVQDENGCVDSASSQICVEDRFGVWVPNAFTPNNDGINDTFTVTSTVHSPDLFALEIFDRWGGLVFRSSSIEEAWDGTGTMDGIFAWKVRIRDSSGNMHESDGHVMLLR